MREPPGDSVPVGVLRRGHARHLLASHPGLPRKESNFIPDVVAAVSFPVIAIGGIRPEHVRSLVHRGAHGVAAIRGIWNDENSELAASRYLSQV